MNDFNNKNGQLTNIKTKSNRLTKTPKTLQSEMEWNNRYQGNKRIWSANASSALVEVANDLKPGHAIDIGAGEGRNSIWLASKGWTVDALDFSEVALVKAQNYAKKAGVSEKINFNHVDLTQFEPGKTTYDLVGLFYFHIPWANMVSVLNKAVRLVAPGGSFVLMAHDKDNIKNGFGGPQDCDVLYSASDVVKLLEDDLNVERAECVKRIVTTGNGERVALDCVVIAKR